MKTTFVLAAAALAHLVAAAPRPLNYARDDTEYDDDSCAAPEPEPKPEPVHHHHHHLHHSHSSALESTTTVQVPSTTPTPTFLSSASTLATSISVAPVSSSVASVVQPTSSTSASVSAPAVSPSATGSIVAGSNPYTYNGAKPGLSGFPGIATNDASGFNELAPYLSWYSDYTPTTADVGNVKGIPMVSFLYLENTRDQIC